MAKTPPLLPGEALQRVTRRGRINGMWVLVMGSTFALLGASAGEVPGVLAWLLVAGTGAMALHGVTLLNQGEPRGLSWLINGQLVCMGFILALCAWQLTHVDLSPLRIAVTNEMRASLSETGMTEDQFLLLSYRLTYSLVALLAIAYPGSMALFYRQQRDAVVAALELGLNSDEQLT